MNTYEYIIDKYKIKVGHQYIVNVPEVGGSRGLARLFAELGFKEGMEVGVFMGEYSEVLCKENPGLHLYGVDSWKMDEYPEGYLEQSHPLPGTMDQKFWDDMRLSTQKRLAQYNYTEIWKTSMAAAKDFPNNSLDFCYIDANHDFPRFTEDLHAWKAKVKIGGILAGHDYMRFQPYKMVHVREVLQGYTRSYKMIPFFVIPRVHNRDRRDLYGNWFWVKNHD